jgi:hypothetical protein
MEKSKKRVWGRYKTKLGANQEKKKIAYILDLSEITLVHLFHYHIE